MTRQTCSGDGFAPSIGRVAATGLRVRAEARSTVCRTLELGRGGECRRAELACCCDRHSSSLSI